MGEVKERKEGGSDNKVKSCDLTDLSSIAFLAALIVLISLWSPGFWNL